jgi:hypothetical protein
VHNEMFLVCGGKCLLGKAAHNWVHKLHFTDDKEVETVMRKLMR